MQCALRAPWVVQQNSDHQVVQLQGGQLDADQVQRIDRLATKERVFSPLALSLARRGRMRQQTEIRPHHLVDATEVSESLRRRSASLMFMQHAAAGN